MVELIFFLGTVVLLFATIPTMVHLVIREHFDNLIPYRRFKYEFTKDDVIVRNVVICFGVVVFILGIFVEPREQNYTSLIINVANLGIIWMNWEARRLIISKLK